MSFPRYKRYKESGVEWLGEVPEHWEVKRLKHLADIRLSNVDKHSVTGQRAVSLCNYVDVYKNDKITATIDFMPATASDEQIERLTVFRGDVIITKDSEEPSDIGVPALIAEDIPGLVCGYHLALIRPIKSAGGFLRHLFQSDFVRSVFEVEATGMTRYALGKYSIENLTVASPSLLEQQAISAFLDRETAKIDALIAEQQRLIALLAEKRQATISHAVTKGLNPDAPMKNSGFEWLGEVPEGCEVKRLRFIADVQTGVAKGKDNIGRTTIEVPYLRVANVQDGYLDLENIAMIAIPAEDLSRYCLQVGDVLMNEGGDYDKLGRGHVWNGEIDPCIHQNHVFAVRPKTVSSAWLNAITGSAYAQFYFMTRSKQSTNLASISSSNIMELPVVLPPAEEQQSVLSFIEQQGKYFDTLTAEAQRAIALLQERRSALISAAVTGKIDVR